MLLTALQVKSAKPQSKTLRFRDGRGLYLVVRPSGSKAWIQRIVIDGRRTDIGLGGYPDVSLARAREKSQEIRVAVADGRNPRDERRQSAALPTFREVAERYIQANAPTWRSMKTIQGARSRFESYAYPVFGDARIDRITRRDVLAAIEPIWTAKPSAGRKLRQQIRAVFAYALAHEWVESNPAGEAIGAALAKTPAVKNHFRALPYRDVSAVLRTVEESGSRLAVRLCFRFLVLTAARSGEARGARWDEIDLDTRTWSVPAERMKAGREHRVPLSDAAMEVLHRAEELRGRSGLVFPSSRGKKLSDMTLTKMLRDNGLAEATTVHGFRTSFKTWAMEMTDAPWAVGEAALAHTLGNSTEQAYARSTLFERRRTLMQEWTDYIT